VLLYLGEGERGTLYPSREALAEVNRQCAEMMAKGPVNASLTLLPPIDDFLRDVEGHAKSLGPRLRIPAEVLDGTPESLDAVDKALKRIPWAKRQVPDLVTPLVAYLGEVIRRATGGQWTKAPPTRERQVPIYDPAEMAAYAAAFEAVIPIADAAAKKAADEARARRASAGDVAHASNTARAEARREVEATRPKPIRIEIHQEPITGHENEPFITASGSRLFQPFASVFLPMVEPSKRIPLRSAVPVPAPRAVGGSPSPSIP
jgi:hypothetical protein